MRSLKVDIIFIVGVNKMASPLAWSSHTIKRVVKSTLGAETLAFQTGVEAALLLRGIILEIYNLPDEEQHVPIECRTDSKSLYDNLMGTKNVSDKRLRLDVAYIKDKIRRKEIARITWVPTEYQLADCLTKQGASADKLLQILGGHELLLPEETDH